MKTALNLPPEILKSEANIFKDELGKHLNQYIVGKTIGWGAYSKVRLVTKEEEKFAMK